MHYTKEFNSRTQTEERKKRRDNDGVDDDEKEDSRDFRHTCVT